MQVALLGYGTEGKEAYDYYKALGADITICARNKGGDTAVPDGVESQLGDGYLANLDRFDVLVRSAGIPPHIIYDAEPGVTSKVTTIINEFMRVCPTRNIIGVTGTKGKGTTSTLITKILEATGRDVHLGGNIGVPPTTFLDKLTPDSWVVLELSSFQLIDMHYSPRIAVCLMVVPEHLNWHADMAEYLEAKSQLFVHQNSDDVAIYFADNNNSRQIASAGKGRKVPYYQAPGAYVDNGAISIDSKVICSTDDLKLLGAHNWQNVCAAVTAVWEAGIRDVVAIRSAITAFGGLEHRLELVRELDGVKYYNDSFGTTPETAIVAVRAFAQPKVVVLGGSDKGASYDELAAAVKDGNVRKVLLVGEQANRIQQALEAAGFHDYMSGGSTMSEIVANMHEVAQPGDIALFSTGCASFDMFHDYKDRGNQFKQQVLALQ